MSKIGLAMEGGGLRGIFTAGAIDCLLDNEINFDYVVGASAGACNTFSYVGKANKYMKNIITMKNPFKSFYGVPQMIESHKYIDLDKVFYEYTVTYDFDFDTFINNPVKWEMVVSNMHTGKAEYMSSHDVEKAKTIGKASCSLPIITSPVEIDNQLYLDGGICDPIPFERAFESGCDKVVAILTRKKGNYSVSKQATQTLFKRFYGDYPEFLNALLERNELYVKQVEKIEELERQGKAIIIRPTMQEVGRMESDLSQLSLAYFHGYTKCKEYLDIIRSWA